VQRTPGPTFVSLGDFALRVARVVKNGHRIWSLSPALRERLMLAVTGVNDCRYCRFVHTRAATVAGVSRDEQLAILDGDFRLTPGEERTALEWARTWALQGGSATPGQQLKLAEVYGSQRALAVAAAVEAIAVGNYTGNGLDQLLGRR
jgi:AhpD family alkylhydroperoxidase